MGTTIVFAAVVVNVQVEDASTLVNGLEIEPQAKELFGLIQRKTQVDFMVNELNVDLGLVQREAAFGQLGQRCHICAGSSGAKGTNQVILKKDQLGASGVLYYTLETNDFTAEEDGCFTISNNDKISKSSFPVFRKTAFAV